VEIRRALETDFDAMWSIFQSVVASGDTYVFSPTTTRQEAFGYWFGPGIASYVATDGSLVLGMYKLRAVPPGSSGGQRLSRGAYVTRRGPTHQATTPAWP
jgi:hypothetical protein